MSWVRLDDTLHGHPKAAKAGLEALGLHMLAMSHCGQYSPKGHVAPEFVREKAGAKGSKLAKRLVESGLWETNGNGWLIHDWSEYNPSAEQSAARRAEISAKRAEAGRRGAEATNRKRQEQPA
jgi:hypothetical protein